MGIKTILLTGLGFLFLGLAAIGFLVPFWPSTALILVSCTCFSRKPHIKAKIMKISYFREYIENYQNGSGLSKKTVVISLSYLWGMLILSMFLIRLFFITILFFAAGIAATFLIFWMAKAKNKDGKP